MTFPYTVRPGDYLVAIAKRFGVRTWQELYRHPDNAPFRAKRPNPDKIFPGDVIRVPVTFTAQTTLLLTTAPPAVILDPRDATKATTQSFAAQFQWGARVTMRPQVGDFQVGFIQNLLSFSSEWLYTSGPQDPTPRRALVSVNVLPCLDNKRGTVTPWCKDRFVQMGALPLRDPPPVPPPEDTADVFDSDTPGGSLPLVHPKDPSRSLARITESMTFITWLAVRPADSPDREVRSYQFLKHVRWGFDRVAVIQSTAPLAATFLRNTMTSTPGEGVGTVDGTPVLNPPLPTSPGNLNGTGL